MSDSENSNCGHERFNYDDCIASTRSTSSSSFSLHLDEDEELDEEDVSKVFTPEMLENINLTAGDSFSLLFAVISKIEKLLNRSHSDIIPNGGKNGKKNIWLKNHINVIKTVLLQKSHLFNVAVTNLNGHFYFSNYKDSNRQKLKRQSSAKSAAEKSNVEVESHVQEVNTISHESDTVGKSANKMSLKKELKSLQIAHNSGNKDNNGQKLERQSSAKSAAEKSNVEVESYVQEVNTIIHEADNVSKSPNKMSPKKKRKSLRLAHKNGKVAINKLERVSLRLFSAMTTSTPKPVVQRSKKRLASEPAANPKKRARKSVEVKMKKTGPKSASNEALTSKSANAERKTKSFTYGDTNVPEDVSKNAELNTEPSRERVRRKLYTADSWLQSISAGHLLLS